MQLYVMPMRQTFKNENGDKLIMVSLFNTIRAGYHIKLLKDRFLRALVLPAALYTEMPNGFKEKMTNGQNTRQSQFSLGILQFQIIYNKYSSKMNNKISKVSVLVSTSLLLFLLKKIIPQQWSLINESKVRAVEILQESYWS